MQVRQDVQCCTRSDENIRILCSHPLGYHPCSRVLIRPSVSGAIGLAHIEICLRVHVEMGGLTPKMHRMWTYKEDMYDENSIYVE